MSTPTERQNLINSLIIDNNTGQISPAKMREVLTSLNLAIVVTESSGVSAVLPLMYNNFTNQFSISLATALQDGYLSKEDFAKFNTASTAPQADEITIKHKGWFNGVKNTAIEIQLGDICQGWNAGHTEFMEAGRYVIFGNDQDTANYEILSSYGLSLIP
jgi:hypothetical protein